jgi:hypothetical protein
MGDALDQLIRDVTLVTLALAIAVGWSLFQVASGIADLVSTLLIDFPSEAEVFAENLSQPLTWELGGRVLTFGSLFRGTIELAVALLVTYLVLRARAAPERRAPEG